MEKADALTAIDVFAGAGGFSLAARRLGIDVRAAIEVDSYACATYRRNFCNPNKSSPPYVVENDIRALDWSAVKRLSGLRKGECSILMGGPPCQGFSAHRIKGAGVGDPRNELLVSYFDAVSALQPMTFVVENVTGMLWARHRPFLDRFMFLAREAGYVVAEPVVLNARDYGVPQNRKRVFIIGWRRGLNIRIQWPPSRTHFAPDAEEVVCSGRPSFVTAASVFQTPLFDDDINAVHINHSPALLEVFRKTPHDGGSRRDSGRVLPCHENHNGHNDVYGRIRLSEPGPTMTTACINPSKGRFLHPFEDHGITARHAARFQGFPDSFIFEGGLFASAKQIGNAVPPPLGRRVLSVLKAGIRDATFKTSHSRRLAD